MSGQPTDEEIIDAIRQGGMSADLALEKLYDYSRAMIIRFAMQNNGSKADGLDLLQDTLLIVCQQIRNGKYHPSGKLSGYIYAIAHHRWLNTLRRRQTGEIIHQTLPMEHQQESHLQHMIEAENESAIKSVFQLLGDDCRKLLLAVFYDQLENSKIAVMMQYQNEQIVRNKKYKCLQKLRDMITANPALHALLKSVRHG
jgi:RNA polymerase sigma factor (sigma-70 family)